MTARCGAPGRARRDRVASELLGPGATDLAGSVAHEAAGNPFFIGELVKYVQITGKGSLGSVRLDDVIGARKAQLSEAGRRILALVSLAGEPITRRALGAAAGVSSAELAKEAGPLRTLHFIRGEGTRGEDLVEPYHDRLRETVLGRKGPSERAELHAALARARGGIGEIAEVAQRDRDMRVLRTEAGLAQGERALVDGTRLDHAPQPTSASQRADPRPPQPLGLASLAGERSFGARFPTRRAQFLGRGRGHV